MTELEKGQKVDIIGPLGNGFTSPPPLSSRNAILIGGGIGIVSLFPLAQALKGREKTLRPYWGKDEDRYSVRERF